MSSSSPVSTSSSSNCCAPEGSTAAARPRRPSAGTVVIALMLLLGTQPISTDLYLPSLPSLPGYFGVPVATVQLTLSVLVVCFGAAQLPLGALSDRIGRRPVLLGGLALYTAASALAMVATHIGALVACRAAQGIGMAACVVGVRAMLRDLYAPQEGAHMLARGSTWMSLIPLLGPVLGGYIESHWGWRGAFAVLTAFGALTLLYVATRLPESLSRRGAGRWTEGWSEILRHPGFWSYTAVSSFTYAGLFSFIAGSSFVLVKVLGLTRQEFGFAFAFVVSGYLIGSTVCRHLIPRRGLVRTLRLAAWVSLAAGTLMAGLAWAGVHHPLALMVPQFVYTLAHGLHQPCAQVGAIAAFPQRAGTASALSGFVGMTLAFGVGYWIGWSFDGTVYPLALTVAFWSAAVAAAALLLVPRYAHHSHAE